MYAPSIFESQPNSGYLPTALSAIQVVFSFATIFVMDKFGRRTLFLVGAILATIGHLLCCIGYDESGDNTGKNWTFNVGAFLFIGIFNVSYGAVTYFTFNPIDGFI